MRNHDLTTEHTPAMTATRVNARLPLSDEDAAALIARVRELENPKSRCGECIQGVGDLWLCPDHQEERFAWFRRQLEDAREKTASYGRVTAYASKRVEAAEARVSQLTETLEFYAKEHAFGKRARAVLSGVPEKPEKEN